MQGERSGWIPGLLRRRPAGLGGESGMRGERGRCRGDSQVCFVHGKVAAIQGDKDGMGECYFELCFNRQLSVIAFWSGVTCFLS